MDLVFLFLVLLCFSVWDYNPEFESVAFDLILNNPENPMELFPAYATLCKCVVRVGGTQEIINR